ncbi:hypothetical protein HN709_01150 [Candidatus Peregrinibacteria bacterium]|jgi:DMSO/TMAO reductase YedYZ heme-binding membrane subunit|nr:hypothetical protein [Candidatus Peregrinibacteria bacterium]MBT7736270.1 hypothetical protein [Candidatus Peregrinibacteria bacterium]
MIRDFLEKMILEGRVPGFVYLKKILWGLAFLLPLLIFLNPQNFRDFADAGWSILIAVMLVRPLADVFPRIKIFRTLVLLRQEFGVMSALLLMAHFVGFAMMKDGGVIGVLMSPTYWDLKRFFGWGMLGLVFVIPVLLTSNKWAMIKMKKWWKRIQKLSYVFFIFGGVHVFMVGEESGIVGIVLVGMFWLLAEFKIVLLKKN